jgi:CubicO group peptidase (beta-lactamase class C family)
MVLCGFGMLALIGSCNTLLQTIVDDDNHGRVMSIFIMAFSGVVPSVVSTLMGIALEEKMINSIKDPVTKYVPLLKKSGCNNVSIKDVLQLSSGIRFNEDYADIFSDINKVGRIIALGTSLDKFVVSLKSGREPGTFNHYVSMDTQVLGIVIREATKKTLSAYLEEKIWSKIGIS